MGHNEFTTALIEHLRRPMDGINAPDDTYIEEMIKLGADIEALDEDGFTPLLRCLSYPYPASNRGGMQTAIKSALAALLRVGSNLAATTPQGQSAADLAALWSGSVATDMLASETYRRSDPTLMALFSHIDPSWPKAGQPVTSDMKYQFLNACHTGAIDEINYTVHFYPDAVHWVDEKWQSGLSNPLTTAIIQANPREKVADLLIKTGCDVNWQDSRGMTALHSLCTRDSASSAIYIPKLIASGARTDLRNENGYTARELAEHNGLTNIITTLDVSMETYSQIQAILSNHYNAQARQARAGEITQRRTNDGSKFKL